jgi:hypothetical protein
MSHTQNSGANSAVASPLNKGDHPEMDMSDELDQKGVTQHQSLIGAMQWAASLGRIGITTAAMAMSSFRAAPRKAHLDRVKRICGHLSKFRHAVMQFRTEKPDCLDLPDQDFDWCRTVCGEVREVLPKDAPEPLGKPVTTTTCVDANLHHDISGQLTPRVFAAFRANHWAKGAQSCADCVRASATFAPGSLRLRFLPAFDSLPVRHVQLHQVHRTLVG